jgi:hypothetical protein
VNQVQKFVLSNDGFGDGGNVDAHIFSDLYWRPKVDVFKIENGKATIPGGGGAVEKRLYSGHYSGGRSYFAQIVDQVPAHREAHTVDLSFARALECYKSCVGGPTPGG